MLRSRWNGFAPSVRVSMIIGPAEGALLLFLTAPLLGVWSFFPAIFVAVVQNPLWLIKAPLLIPVFAFYAVFTLTPFFICASTIILILAPLPIGVKRTLGFLLSRGVIITSLLLMPALVAILLGIPV